MSYSTAAIIDVGTNSIKLIVGRVNARGEVEVLSESAAITRLGEGLDIMRNISPEAEERAVEAISDMVRTARGLGCFGCMQPKQLLIRVVGTSAVRDAVNRDRLIDRLRAELGVDLEVLSEEDECRFSYLAVALDPALGTYEGPHVVADVGGGSTELALGVGSRLETGISLKLGVVRLTERFLTSDPPSSSALKSAREEADSLVSKWLKGRKPGRVVGVGGSAINLMRIHRRIPADTIEGVHGSLISRDNLTELLDTLASLTVEQRKQIIGLEPDRADTILAGAIIFERMLAASNAHQLIISTRGLRYGLLCEVLTGGRGKG
ncbi:MAG: hypothetical protein M1133_16690 [Armatimonadetes bacterium]|nr:hypothetical protein [Armatimonadota bacterium]